MDAMTLILTALTTGAALVAKTTASEAVKDAYKSLKARLQSKLTGKPDAELALTKHEEKPEIWEAPLRDVLTEAAADQDEVVVQAARKLMALANPKQAAMGKYNVQIAGNAQGIVSGDNAQVKMIFRGNEEE